MRDQEVSPGFFLGVMGLVGAAVVKNPTAKVRACANCLWIQVSSPKNQN